MVFAENPSLGKESISAGLSQAANTISTKTIDGAILAGNYFLIDTAFMSTPLKSARRIFSYET